MFKILKHFRVPKNILLSRLAQPVSTINIKEIEHHNKLSKVWWEGKDLLALRRFTPLRVQFVREGLANIGFQFGENQCLPLQAVKIADIGCGGGILSESLARAGANVTGIDAAEDMIKVAKSHAKLDPDIWDRLDYIHTTIEKFAPDNEELYDVVVASEVIEHINNPDLFLKECVKILKPEGSIFITAPNQTFLSWLGVIVLAEYILNDVPYNTHDWNKFIPPHEVQRMLDNHNCRTILLNGIIFNPLTYRWSWSSNLTFCYALHAVKEKKVTHNNV